MTTVPKGYVKMDLCLAFNRKNAEIFINQVLRMLVCEFHIYYSKKFLDDENWQFDFWCNPRYCSSVAYQMGVYCQTMFGFQTKRHIRSSKHTLPRPFPESIEVKPEGQQ